MYCTRSNYPNSQNNYQYGRLVLNGKQIHVNLANGLFGCKITDLKKMERTLTTNNSRGRYPTIDLSLLAPASLCSLINIAVDLQPFHVPFPLLEAVQNVVVTLCNQRGSL